MASFVTEVLASSGKLEKEDLASKISRMSRKVEDTKVVFFWLALAAANISVK